MWCGCRMPFPLFTYLPAAAAAEANKSEVSEARQRGVAIGVDRGGEAALTWRGGRRARCGARGGCPRRGRGCSGCGPASGQTWPPPPVGRSFAARAPARGRPRVWCGGGDWRVGEAWREMRENRAEDTRLHTRPAAWSPTAWRPVCGRVAGEGPDHRERVCSVRLCVCPRASGRGCVGPASQRI